MTTPVDEQPPPPNRTQPPPHPSGRTAETALRWSMVGMMLLLVIGLAFALGFTTRVLVENSAAADDPVATLRKDGSPDFRVLDDIYKVLKERYIEPERLDPELLRTGAINGLLNAVGDTHQVYLTKTQAEFESDSLAGQFEGIGCTVDQKGGEIIIVRPFEGSPAKNAGLRPGDAILAINGESTKGFTIRDAQRRIRGPAGTDVKLQVRHTDGKIEELTITRATIELPSVIADKPQDAQGNVVEDIAYVRIEQFTQRTPDELRRYLESIQGKGYKGLIIDLRNNPGGLVRSLMGVAEQFLRGQTILIEQHRNGVEEALKTGGRGIALDIPLVVLVNHNSASASEVLSGALRDHKRATIVGETTLGKGTVNQFYDLRDGGKLYVTIARWLTPKRDLIEGKGVRPDLEVQVADNENPLDYYNSVMYRAVDLLRAGSAKRD
jgi:carboxyl-terminal processing protease